MSGGSASGIANSRSANIESELDLVFRRNSTDIFVMGVVLVPVRSIASGNEDALLVSRSQGFHVGQTVVKHATKSLNEISPPYALLSAVLGLAKFLEIPTLYGVSARNQIFSGSGEPPHDFVTAYDEFWETLGMKEELPGFYASPIPLLEKPILSLRQHRRARTLAKREVKRAIAAEVFANLERMNDRRQCPVRPVV